MGNDTNRSRQYRGSQDDSHSSGARRSSSFSSSRSQSSRSQSPRSQSARSNPSRSSSRPKRTRSSDRPSPGSSLRAERTTSESRRQFAVQKKNTSRKTKLIVGGVLALVVVVGVCFGIYHLLHTEIVIEDDAAMMPKDTTYAELRERGYLTAAPGNLLAVDGSILEVGAGHPPRVLADGEVVEDLDTLLDPGAVITEEQGADMTEPVTTEETVIPFQTLLEQGDYFQFFSGSTLHVAFDPGQDGIEVIETGTISGIVRPPYMAQEMKPKVFVGRYPNVPGKKLVAFTYDDGPDPTYTHQILEVLDKYGVKATFFMLGTSVANYPDVAKDVADAGHEVASHSFQHDAGNYLNRLDAKGAAFQMSTAFDLIYNATGREARHLRPPGGNLSGANAIAGSPWVDAYVGWDIGTGDYTLPGVEGIVSKVRDEIHSGSIVLMHDGGGDRSQTVEASDILIRELLAEGYEFVTIEELISSIRGKAAPER